MNYLYGLVFILCTISTARAQYYYQDLAGTADITSQMKMYKAGNIQKVIAAGYKSDGSVSPDYSEIQETDPFFRTLKISTYVNGESTRLLYTFDEQGRLLSLLDSSAALTSFSRYLYDDSGKLVEITNVLNDSMKDFSQTEIHRWIYQSGYPEKMWRIINSSDSMEVRFKADENGNVTEEQNVKNGKAADPVYYYYDDKNRLTDIVRYNAKARRLLPDYMFEYDEKNRVIQKISTLSNQNIGYLIWRYLYNDEGLKIKEALYNRQKQLQGKIEYSYTRY
jgi:YD repeat-containing protein